MRKNSGVSISRTNICPLACSAYTKALTPENLQSSFRKAGIYPLDKNVVDPSNFLPATTLEIEQCDDEVLSGEISHDKVNDTVND